MQFKDYYKLMGLDEKASADEVKKAYRRLARKYHPDVSKEKDAEQKFKELGEAYEVLGDKEKRAEYDRLKKLGAQGRHGEFRPPPGWESAAGFEAGSGDFSDFFASMFGNRANFRTAGSGAGSHAFSMRGEDLHYELPLFLEEVYRGTEKLLNLQVPVSDERGFVSYRDKTLRVKIPAGTEDGQHLKLKGQGAPGTGRGAAGDLLVTVRLAPHPLYEVQGRNLGMVLPVAPWEAALGARVTVPTPGGKIKVSVPPRSQTGSKLRLQGKGLPGKPPGDLLLTLKVLMPTGETAKSRELYQALAEELPFNPRAQWE